MQKLWVQKQVFRYKIWRKNDMEMEKATNSISPFSCTRAYTEFDSKDETMKKHLL